MSLNQITIDGNLTSDPELRFTPSGSAVCNGTVAHTPRVKRGDEWEDGETVFLNWSVWKDQAENVAESLRRGDRVVVIGKLKVRSYETRDGEKRQSWEVEHATVTPSLERATAKVTRTQRSGAQQGAPQGGDPWATGGSSSGASSGPSWGSAGNDEPPF